MKNRIGFLSYSVAFLLGLGLVWSEAQQADALIDKLVEKGVLTTTEGEEVRTKLQEEWEGMGASKYDASKFTKKISLFGDLQLRYEYTDSQNAFDDDREGAFPDSSAMRDDRSRTRYRLRFGLKTQLADNFELGLRLASGNNDEEITSTHETLGDAFAKDGIYIDLAYLKYSPFDWSTIWVGKHEQQFWTTDMLWDNDITIEGATEQFKFDLGKAKFFVNLGQWAFGDVNEADEDKTVRGDGYNRVSNDDGWIWATQAGVNYPIIDKTLEAQAAVGFYYFANSEDLDNSQKTLSNGVIYPNPGSGNNLGNEFQLLDALFQLTYTPSDGFLKNIPIQPYAHLVYNMAPAPDLGVRRIGHDSTLDAQLNPDDIGDSADARGKWVDLSNDLAWRVGLKIGEAKKQGQWEINGWYEEVGSDAVPDTFNDATYANGFTNHRGFSVKAVYAIRDWWNVAVNFHNYDFLDPDINQELNLNTQNQARTIQIDSTVKF
ncbi:MAG: putative porin [Verrucomicrobiae bacterium]|nr:putative porin [Verrucomicrobiae bacterium]